MMTRFEMELSGMLGDWWKRNAEQEIAKMQERVDNKEIRTNCSGGAFWLSNGNYLQEEQAIILSHTDFSFSLEETAKAREAQTAMFLENYRKTYTGPNEEERREMRAAFGEGTEVVNILTGEITIA